MIKSGLWWSYSSVHIEVKRELRWCFPILPYFLVHGLLYVTSTSQQCWKPLCRSFVSSCVPGTMWLMLQFNTFSFDRAVQPFSYLVSCCRINKNRVLSKFTTYIILASFVMIQDSSINVFSNSLFHLVEREFRRWHTLKWFNWVL